METVWSAGDKKFAFSLIGVLRERMPEVLSGMAGIEPEKRVASVSSEERARFIELLKAVPLNPGEPRSFKEAVAAAGGVDVDEINPSTMESRLVKNLFITGELLDIDGDSGDTTCSLPGAAGPSPGWPNSRTRRASYSLQEMLCCCRPISGAHEREIDPTQYRI
jgi:hypothetical protein